MTETQQDKSEFKVTKDTPYLALTGELYGVCCEDISENWPRYNGSALYNETWTLWRSVAIAGNQVIHYTCNIIVTLKIASNEYIFHTFCAPLDTLRYWTCSRYWNIFSCVKEFERCCSKSAKILYNIWYKQRVLTPGHQGWNDLHSLCRIGMGYYLLNYNNNNNNNNNNDNNNNNNNNNDNNDDDNEW